MLTIRYKKDMTDNYAVVKSLVSHQLGLSCIILSKRTQQRWWCAFANEMCDISLGLCYSNHSDPDFNENTIKTTSSDPKEITLQPCRPKLPFNQ